VSESDWSSDYEEFVEKNGRSDAQKEEKTRETAHRPTIPSKRNNHFIHFTDVFRSRLLLVIFGVQSLCGWNLRLRRR
jgi:hypothetical protein